MSAEFAIGAQAEARTSWVPMIAIALGQVLMSYNVASLPVALGGAWSRASASRRPRLQLAS
jgi:hypothetical protein